MADEMADELADAVPDRVRQRLVLVVALPAGVKEVDLAPPRLTIGRASSGHLVIDHPSISRAHAEIVVSAEGALVRDLGSTNGTSVNGEKMGDKGVVLRDGDEVAFGGIVAHVKVRAAAGDIAQRLLQPHEFDARLATETDRCMRDNRSLTV